MKKARRLPPPCLEQLASLLQFIPSVKPRVAVLCLKRARRVLKRELHRLEKRRKPSRKHARPAEAWTPAAIPETRRVQVLNVRPGVLEAGIPPPPGFDFRPPDPGVVQRLLTHGGRPGAGNAAEPEEGAPPPSASSAPDASDDDLLILAAGERASPESVPAAGGPPPPAIFDPAANGLPPDLPTP